MCGSVNFIDKNYEENFSVSPFLSSRWLSVSFSVSPSLLSLSLSFHIYDRPVMCTQDRWGTARWPLLPWQQNGYREERVKDFFSFWLVLGEIQRICEEGSRDTKKEHQCFSFSAASLWTSAIKLGQLSSLVFRVRTICLFISYLTQTPRFNIHWHSVSIAL